MSVHAVTRLISSLNYVRSGQSFEGVFMNLFLQNKKNKIKKWK